MSEDGFLTTTKAVRGHEKAAEGAPASAARPAPSILVHDRPERGKHPLRVPGVGGRSGR